MHKKAVLKLASGFRGRAGNCIRIARERVEKALQYATRDRRAKKRDVRSLWIARINAGAREHGVSSCGLVSPYFSSTFVWMLSCSARKEVGAFERERARNWLVIISNRPSSDGLDFFAHLCQKKNQPPSAHVLDLHRRTESREHRAQPQDLVRLCREGAAELRGAGREGPGPAGEGGRQGRLRGGGA